MRDPELQALLDERARTMLDFTADHRPMNLYAVYRSDLNMEPGKLVAQCGHAYQFSLKAARVMNPDIDAHTKAPVTVPSCACMPRTRAS